jgi:hypothetical protein
MSHEKNNSSLDVTGHEVRIVFFECLYKESNICGEKMGDELELQVIPTK